jgi:hypothetical protein
MTGSIRAIRRDSLPRGNEAAADGLSTAEEVLLISLIA